MYVTDRDLTQLGALLESAREALGLSMRTVAERAGVSSGRWHQVVTGRQQKGDRLMPVNPKSRTVVAMSVAVAVDPAEALSAAGIEMTPDEITKLVDDVRRELAQRNSADAAPTVPANLADEVKRIGALDLSADERLEIIRTVVALYEQQQRDAGNDPSAPRVAPG
jgi:transcriptional regulator with XRE-family HTH domain